ncbi:MAG: hypothetical protein QOF81_17 [Acidimicrobiaceae bacterium]|nr:hypothetical protein [Acidimicrobiaceae bacterium]
MNDRVTALPSSDRWRPTRAGLVALWRYWDETFVFHRGRLLLRGPNGSGKSMALELLLPFLLDGDTSPTKLTSAAKSRGRLFDRVMTGSDEATRTGFAWVEFGRSDQTFTVGARIRASQGTGRADVDLFTTTLAVGRDLHLLDDHRTPLSRKALVEAIGDSGRVQPSAEEHRAAVREVLFPGFSADRYTSVIGALLALRKEKLSQNLDLDKLSDVLSEALPPIDEHDIAAVAEGFERLDRRRAELTALERDLNEVRLLARHQRDYARAVTVGAAAKVRSAETRRDDVTRSERLAKEVLEEAQHRARAAAGERQAIEQRDAVIGAEMDALKDSDAYRDGAALTDLRVQASRLRRNADRTQQGVAERRRAHAVTVAEFDEATSVHQECAANLERATRDLRAVAGNAGAETMLGEAETFDEPDDAERLIHAWVSAQRTRAGEVRAALGAHEQAVAQRTFLDEQVAQDEAAVDDRAEAHRVAVQAAGAAVDAYRAAVETWAARCQAIDPSRLAALPRPPDEPLQVVEAIARVVAAVRTEEAVARQQLADQRRAASDEREQLETERARWAHGGLVDPDGPQWRSDRTGRPGAPLWRLVDLAPGLSPTEVDGLEGSLVGGGLLDAWVTPDGQVDPGPQRCDVVLTVSELPGDTMASLLVPADDAYEQYGVTAEVIAAVLASIPVAGTVRGSARFGPGGASDVVVATDASFRLGSAVGQGPLRPAMVLGAVARERHRLARLAELDAAITVVDARLADLDRQTVTLDRWRAAVDAEAAALPSGESVDEARKRTAAAATRLAEARDRLDGTRAERRAAEDSVRAALRALTALASRHGLPADRDALAQVEVVLGRLWDATTTWARRHRELQAAEWTRTRAAEHTSQEREAVERAEAHLLEAERDASDVERRVTALQSSIGVEFGAILQRISRLGEERTTGRRRAEDLAIETQALDRRVGELGTKVEIAAGERAAAEVNRDGAHRGLVAALDSLSGDAGIAVPGLLDTATDVLAMARSIASAFEQVDTERQTIERLSERVRERVYQAQAALGARVDFERQFDVVADEGWWVVRTTANGIRRRVADLASALATELAEGKAEFAADEEHLFEQTLAGSVRRALANRIREANALVDTINRQLAAVRTAAGGVEVRLRWEVDAGQLPAVKAARSLLLRDPADLSEADRSSLQDFVRARVDQARADLEVNAPWEARLRETLDYRAWHRFTLQLGHRDWEGFQPATPRRLQKLSTGERSIALHLPMIASVAAHYADDGPGSGCPRLILLDELFAGVDTANRAQLFGTFSTWDLDAVFTSDHEWCQYASLDGIAIHHLHPPIGDEPVTSTRFTWDGRRRQIDPSAA